MELGSADLNSYPIFLVVYFVSAMSFVYRKTCRGSCLVAVSADDRVGGSRSRVLLFGGYVVK